jgi:hypothetical protein
MRVTLERFTVAVFRRGEIAHCASTSESGTGFHPLICESQSQDGCATLVSTGGAPGARSPHDLLGFFHEHLDEQLRGRRLNFAPNHRVGHGGETLEFQGAHSFGNNPGNLDT